MPWLIEAYLEEEMKTSADYYFDRGEKQGEKLANNYVASSSRYAKKYIKDDDKAEKFVDDSVDKALDSITGDRKKLKDNVKKSEKYANDLHKRMAIDRHNNRHPDRQVSNESVWLIETVLDEDYFEEEDEYLDDEYFEEGKHGPDHPESLGMKNADDMLKKHQDIDDNNDDFMVNHSFSVSGYKDASRDKAFAGLKKSKEADIAQKKGYVHGIKNGREVYARNNLENKTKGKIDANIRASEKYLTNRHVRDDRVVRSIRRHDEKLAKQHECADIVEIFQ